MIRDAGFAAQLCFVSHRPCGQAGSDSPPPPLPCLPPCHTIECGTDNGTQRWKE